MDQSGREDKITSADTSSPSRGRAAAVSITLLFDSRQGSATHPNIRLADRAQHPRLVRDLRDEPSAGCCEGDQLVRLPINVSDTHPPVISLIRCCDRTSDEQLRS